MRMCSYPKPLHLLLPPSALPTPHHMPGPDRCPVISLQIDSWPLSRRWDSWPFLAPLPMNSHTWFNILLNYRLMGVACGQQAGGQSHFYTWGQMCCDHG